MCGAGKGTCLVETRRERDEPVARAHAIRRLQSANAGQCGRLANRAAGIGPGSSGHQSRGNGSGRAAGAAAGDIVEMPRVFHRAEVRGLARRPHRELVHVGLADEHGTRAREAFDHVRIERRRVVGKHPRTAGRAHARGDEYVLVRDGDAGKRAAGTPGHRRVGRLGVGQRTLGIDADEGIERRVERGDPVEKTVRELDARQTLRAKCRGELDDGRGDHGERRSRGATPASPASKSIASGHPCLLTGRPSLEYLWHEVQPVLHCRRVSLVTCSEVALGDDVRT